MACYPLHCSSKLHLSAPHQMFEEYCHISPEMINTFYSQPYSDWAQLYCEAVLEGESLLHALYKLPNSNSAWSSSWSPVPGKSKSKTEQEKSIEKRGLPGLFYEMSIFGKLHKSADIYLWPGRPRSAALQWPGEAVPQLGEARGPGPQQTHAPLSEGDVTPVVTPHTEPAPHF